MRLSQRYSRTFGPVWLLVSLSQDLDQTGRRDFPHSPQKISPRNSAKLVSFLVWAADRLALVRLPTMSFSRICRFAFSHNSGVTSASVRASDRSFHWSRGFFLLLRLPTTSVRPVVTTPLYCSSVMIR